MTDMSRVAAQNPGGSKKAAGKKVTMTAGGTVGPHPTTREGKDVTAAQHAAHRGGKKK